MFAIEHRFARLIRSKQPSSCAMIKTGRSSDLPFLELPLWPPLFEQCLFALDFWVTRREERQQKFVMGICHQLDPFVSNDIAAVDLISVCLLNLSTHLRASGHFAELDFRVCGIFNSTKNAQNAQPYGALPMLLLS